MIKKIDHIAIKVTNLQGVIQALSNLGIACNKTEKHDEVGMRIGFLDIGETTIELLEATSLTSPIVQDPPGFHHLGLKTIDIEESFHQMKESNQYKLEGEIRKGAHSRIFFFRIIGQEEILFEFVE